MCLRVDRLDIVAIGIDQKRGKISRAIVLARTRRAIVAAAGFQPCAVEFSDRSMIRCAEGDMGAGTGRPLVQI